MLNRFSAFRDALYARMEEVSFRTSITVLTGVIAVAAVIAGVGLVMSQAPSPARPTALGPAPATRSQTPVSTPATSAPNRSQPASSAPARTPAPVVTSPAREATYPATAENAEPDTTAPAAAPVASPAAAPVQKPASSGLAAWLAWWQQVLASHRGGLGAGSGGLHGGIGWGRR